MTSPPRLTVSGVSSGGYMALQMQVAFSDQINGAGAIAAGPYDCAEGNIVNALGACINGPPPSVSHTVDLMRQRESAGNIAPLARLADRRIWLLHGSHDAVVDRSVVERAADVLIALDAEVQLVTDVPAAHGMPTVNFGAACDQMQTPFLNQCNFDSAGRLLQFLVGDATELTESARATPRGHLFDLPQPQAEGLADVAKVYAPPQCDRRDQCEIHVAFHGCQQSTEFVQQAFVDSAGYNVWADRLGLIILYPQVAATPTNPLGCWDWWGYSDPDYATRQAPQMRAVLAMVDALRSGVQ
ncbi:MAG: PHB depolymerase family esterase [Pseudomonadota bacterium]